MLLDIILLAAAGNESTSQQSYPAAYSGVLSVSAVTMEKKAAWYTNFGPWIDIAAPGGSTSADLNGDGYPDGVLSTGGDDSAATVQFLYTFLQGTSMAAPHVSGVAALMKSIYPGLTFDRFTTLLEKASLTDDTGALGRDDYHGYGLVNAQKGLVAATELAQGVQQPDPPRLAANPGAINFGSSSQSQTLTVVNGGAGDLWMDPPVSK
jgi:serine protease